MCVQYKSFENIVGKREIALNKQFLIKNEKKLVNPLPDDKLLEWSELKQIAHDILNEQEGHDGPEIAHLSLLTKHAPSSFPVT